MRKEKKWMKNKKYNNNKSPHKETQNKYWYLHQCKIPMTMTISIK